MTPLTSPPKTAPAKVTVQPSDLMKIGHPLRPTFVAWCQRKGTTPTRRQAAKFIDANPNLFRVHAA